MADHAGRFLLGGGIGSGKTAAAHRFATLGAHVVSTDELARSLLRPGTMQTEQVIARWPDVQVAPGEIDRRRLGQIVFADPVLLGDLEAITHPEVRAMVDAEIESHETDIVLVEIPILRDLPGRGWPWIVVDAPDATRVVRAAARGSFTHDEVLQVAKRQPSRGEWLAAATWVIDNSGDEEHLAQECGRVWEAMSHES